MEDLPEHAPRRALKILCHLLFLAPSKAAIFLKEAIFCFFVKSRRVLDLKVAIVTERTQSDLETSWTHSSVNTKYPKQAEKSATCMPNLIPYLVYHL